MKKKKTSSKKKSTSFFKPSYSQEVLRFIQANKKVGSKIVMHDFVSRFNPEEATKLLNQLNLCAQGKGPDKIENQDELDEFYVAMNELLIAVYHYSDQIALEQEDSTADA